MNTSHIPLFDWPKSCILPYTLRETAPARGVPRPQPSPGDPSAGADATRRSDAPGASGHALSGKLTLAGNSYSLSPSDRIALEERARLRGYWNQEPHSRREAEEYCRTAERP